MTDRRGRRRRHKRHKSKRIGRRSFEALLVDLRNLPTKLSAWSRAW